MKKIIPLLLALVLCLMLCSCGEKETSIEITMDNWENFFEFKETATWHKNDFDEPSEVEITYAFCVNEEYADKIVVEKTNVVVEVSFVSVYKTFELDLDNQVYSIGDTSNYYPPMEEILTFSTAGSSESYGLYQEYRGLYAIHIASIKPYGCGFVEEGRPHIIYNDDMQITRIQGTISIKGDLPEVIQ